MQVTTSPIKGIYQVTDSDEVMQIQEDQINIENLKRGIIIDEQAAQLNMTSPDIKKQMSKAYLYMNSRVVRDTQSIE